MGKCLSRWCDDVEGGPVSNGNSTHGNNIALESVTGGRPQHHLEPLISGTPNTPRNVHVTMPSFVCQNGDHNTHTVRTESASDSSDNSGRICDFFDLYRDKSEDCILVDGIERLCNDLVVKPDDFSILVLAWRFGASAMCRFTREEFINGCKTLGVDCLSRLQQKLPEIATSASEDRTSFRDMYRWAYRFALDPTTSQRTLPTDIAIAMWRVVFAVPSGSHGIAPSFTWAVPLWLDFIEKHSTARGITRDTWDMFLNFLDSLSEPSMSGYDETEAWPSLFDDFVKWVHERRRRQMAAVVASLDQPTKIDSC